MKTRLAILIVGLIFLATPMLAMAHGSDRYDEGPRQQKSWVKDRHHNDHQRHGYGPGYKWRQHQVKQEVRKQVKRELRHERQERKVRKHYITHQPKHRPQHVRVDPAAAFATERLTHRSASRAIAGSGIASPAL